MRNELPVRTARRLLERMKRLEFKEASDEARDEAQRLLLARHLARLRRRNGLNEKGILYYAP